MNGEDRHAAHQASRASQNNEHPLDSPDEDVAGGGDDRDTMYCPECGHDGAFDGRGYTTETTQKTISTPEGTDYYWFEFRCGECGEVFRRRKDADEVEARETMC